MKNYFKSITCLTGAAVAASSVQAKVPCEVKDTKKPNVVFIMADQWRGNFLGFRGVVPVQTPNLDNLSKEGISFNNAMSCYPVSSPARACWLTGMYPAQNKVITNCNSNSAPYGVELDKDARCWSDVLHDAGYATGYIGKWHLDSPYKPYVDTYNNRGGVAWNEWCPPERRHGFETWTAYGTYDNHLHPMYWSKDTKRDDFYYVDQWGPTYEANLAVSFIDSVAQNNKPFALVVSMNPPHTGYELCPQKYKDLYKGTDVEAICQKLAVPAKGTSGGDYFRKNILNYFACMTGVDVEVGRIIKALKEKNLFENTLLVFVSDHGINMGIHEIEGKDTYYEESINIPLIMTYPDKIKPRSDNQLQISIADLCPTVLSILGMKKRIPASVMSYDLSEFVLKGKGFQPEFQPYYKFDVKNQNSGWRGIRTNRYTLAIEFKDGKVVDTRLFDRVTDPFEHTNIAQKNQMLTSSLIIKLSRWLRKTNDPLSIHIME